MAMKGPNQSDQVGRATEQKVTYNNTAPLSLLGQVQIMQMLAICLPGERFMLSKWISPA